MTVSTILTPEVVTALRTQLLDAASRPDIEPPVSVKSCTCPILLVGQSRSIHPATGEVLRVFSSDQLPDSRLTVACGNRRQTVCPACSRVYGADAFQLIAATGLIGGKGVPADVTGNPRLFVTFTAPSFGRVHRGPGKDGAARSCHPRRDGSGCNRWHRADDRPSAPRWTPAPTTTRPPCCGTPPPRPCGGGSPSTYAVTWRGWSG